MANYNSILVVQPLIPVGLISEELLEKMSLFGISSEVEDDKYYLFAYEYGGGYNYETGEEFTEEQLIELFQNIIKNSNGLVPWVSFEFSFTCSKMRSDGFGGAASFITANEVEWTSTHFWLMEKVAQSLGEIKC